jgi:hypothetical protein
MASLSVPSLSVVERNRRQSILRQRREAIAEMARNGIMVAPEWADCIDEPDHELPALTVVNTTGKEDFVSAPDAKPMAPEDICNVEKITVPEIRLTLAEALKRLSHEDWKYAYADWAAGKPRWSEDDVRWTLTPMELKRLAETE